MRRDLGDRPVTIGSGCRCRRHNAKVGGARKSKHLTGEACDFWIEGVHPVSVATYLTNRHPSRLGIGTYGSYVHVDTRTNRARWMG